MRTQVIEIAFIAMMSACLGMMGGASADSIYHADGWAYTVQAGEITLRDYAPAFPTILEIPEQINGMPVVQVEDICADDGDYASYGPLSMIIFPKTVRGINISEVIKPENNLFDFELAYVRVDDANKNYASIDGILYSADKKALLACPGRWEGPTLRIPESVEKIGDWAFAGCNLEGIILPDGLKEIGSHAFFYCGLDEQNGLYIPDGVTTLGDSALYFFSASQIHVPASVSLVGGDAFMLEAGEASDESLLLYVHRGSYLERYAYFNDHNYELCDACDYLKKCLQPSAARTSAGMAGVSPSADPSSIPISEGEAIERLEAALVDRMVAGTALLSYGEGDANGVHCWKFAFGADTPEKFTVEYQFAVTDDGTIWVLDMVAGEYAAFSTTP